MSLDVPNIDGLLVCDADNVATCKQMLADLSPVLLGAINDSAALFNTANRVFAQAIEDGDHFGEITRICDEREFESDAQLLPLYETDDEVRGVLDRFRDRDIRGALLVRVGVLNLQLFADFFRIRMTAPMAYLRLQIETVALLEIMSGDAAISVEWSDVGIDDVKGRKFFNKYKKRVLAILEKRNLKRLYDMASGIALPAATLGSHSSPPSHMSRPTGNGSGKRRSDLRNSTRTTRCSSRCRSWTRSGLRCESLSRSSKFYRS